MIVNLILGILAVLSLLLVCWQWLAARRFPLHQRAADPAFAPGVTLLKPLKGADHYTEKCLRSWLEQDYPGKVQILFAVAAADDPVCDLVRRLLADYSSTDSQLIICGELKGANLKIAKLAQVQAMAANDVLVISDADVSVPRDLLSQAVLPLQRPDVGLVNCFYRMANPETAAMRWEAIAVDADFWSQVLQSRSLKPMDFALGAVMLTWKKRLEEIGGFAALENCLADDYQLGNRIARKGHVIELCPVVVECWSEPMGWGAVWRHQLRWARTIRVCQAAPYFFSILSNGTLWPILWVAIAPSKLALGFGLLALTLRVLTALNLRSRLSRARHGWRDLWLVLVKDLLQAALWVAAFAGNAVEWRGERMRLRTDGTLVRSRAD